MSPIRFLLAAVVLVCTPVHAGILFATDFDNYAGFEGEGFPAPNPTTKNCGVEDDPDCSQRCPFAEDGESCAYIGGGCGGQHCSVTVSSVGTDSGKAFQHWTDSGGSGAFQNDGILYWFPPGADHTVTYPEIWVQVKVKFPPSFQWTNDSVQQKLLRISYHPGRGSRQGNFSYGDCTFTSSYGCQRPSVIVDVGRFNGGNSDLFWLFAPRTHVNYGSGADHVYFQNKYGTRYCSGSSGSTCVPGGDESSCPGSCNGSIVADGSYNGDGFDWGMAGHLGTDEWQTWKFRMKANAMGQSNGIFEAYHNGQLQFSRTDYQFFENTQTVKFENGPTQTNKFWTGNANPLTPGFNMVALGGNTTNTPNQEQWYAYDDFCVATSEADLANCFGPQVAACGDGSDNDGDGLVDAADPGCSSDADTSEQSSSLICDDGQDNDGDGLKDTADPGCSSPSDASEQSSALICDDGLDNDNDGSVDTADGGCSSPTDNTEANCGDGTVNGGEVCDGSDLAGQDCTDQGFALPAGLACNASCSAFVTSNCSNEEPIVECMTFDETDDYVSVPDSSTLTMPSGDWTVGIYTRITDTTGNAFQYALSNNTTTANSSFNLFLDESTNRWEGRARDGQGDQVLLTGGAIPADGTWRLLAMRKSGSNFDLLYCSGGSCSTEASDQNAAFGEVNGGEWNIGRRVDGDADRYFGGDACYMFLTDRAMSDEDLIDTSRWVEPLDTGLVHLGVDLLSDRTGNGHNGVYHGGIQGSNFGPPLVQPSCGNGIQEAGEQCDQGDFGGQTCQSAGFGTGSLACTGSCVLDTSGCGANTVPPNVNNLERTDTQE